MQPTCPKCHRTPEECEDWKGHNPVVVTAEDADEDGPLRLVVALMDYNANASASMTNAVISEIERDRDERRERALRAENRVRRIESNIHNLLG